MLNLTHLFIENFKSIEACELELAPITLLYGPNSGGKSSILQALLLLLQTVETHRTTTFNHLVTQGRRVDLGTFQSLVHLQELDRIVSVGFACAPNGQHWGFGDWPARVLLSFQNHEAPSLHGDLRAVDLQTGGEVRGRNLGCHIRLTRRPDDCPLVPKASAQSGQAGQNRGPANYLLDSAWSWKPTDSELHMLEEYLYDSLDDYLDTHPSESATRRDDLRTWALTSLAPLASPDRARFGPGLVPVPPPQNDFQVHFSALMSGFRDALQTTLERIVHLGAWRGTPARLSGQDLLGTNGFAWSSQMLANDQRVLGKVREWFKKLELPYDLKPHQYSGDAVFGQMAAVVLRDRRTMVDVSSVDVGYGMSQLIPMLVAGVASMGSVLCVEQPETHLHPRLQGHLADFFIETAMEGYEGDSLYPRERQQWIVETHSEALIARLQRRIREKKLAPADVKVYYVSPAPEMDPGNRQASRGALIQELRLDESGDFIDEWPHGFFEETFQDRFA